MSIEVLRRVYDSRENNWLTVRASPDFPDENVWLSAENSQTEWFGEINLDMPSQFMRELGFALIACAKEVDSATK